MNRKKLGKVLLWLAIVGGLILMVAKTPQVGLGIYGAIAGAIAGAVRKGHHGGVHGFALGLMAGLVGAGFSSGVAIAAGVIGYNLGLIS